MFDICEFSPVSSFVLFFLSSTPNGSPNGSNTPAVVAWLVAWRGAWLGVLELLSTLLSTGDAELGLIIPRLTSEQEIMAVRRKSATLRVTLRVNLRLA